MTDFAKNQSLDTLFSAGVGDCMFSTSQLERAICQKGDWGHLALRLKLRLIVWLEKKEAWNLRVRRSRSK
jgi:hypothetical protein